MKFGYNELRIKFGLFDYTAIVIIGDKANLRRYLRWKFEDDDFVLGYNRHTRGLVVGRQGYCPIMWLPKRPRTCTEIATVAHECVHVMMHLFSWAGMSVTEDTEEIMAHGVAYMTRMILVKSLPKLAKKGGKI